MCGRYSLSDPQIAFQYIEVDGPLSYPPRYNIAPTQEIPVLPQLGRLELMKWGIEPPWKGILINARSETVREKNTFKKYFQSQRCLVPADAFYEWVKGSKPKRPFLFKMRDSSPFAIAAFWAESPGLRHVCLLTTSPNAVLQPIHDRMPVILRKQDWEQWLEPGDLPEHDFQRLTVPYAADEMTAHEVSPIVNNARTDTPACSLPLNSL